MSAAGTAVEIVEQREKVYGSPASNLQLTAEYWTLALRRKLRPEAKISVADVCQLMRLLKEARLEATPDHFDSLVDICGYADIQGRTV